MSASCNTTTPTILDTQYLFVYGTLRKDEKNEFAQFLSKYSDHLLSVTAQIQKTIMYLIDAQRSFIYPGLVDTNDSTDICVGDVFQFHNNQLKASFEEKNMSKEEQQAILRGEIITMSQVWDFLDEYEGDEYERVLRDVIITDKETGETKSVKCWVYMYVEKTDKYTLIESGDFFKR